MPSAFPAKLPDDSYGELLHNLVNQYSRRLIHATVASSRVVQGVKSKEQKHLHSERTMQTAGEALLTHGVRQLITGKKSAKEVLWVSGC